MVATAVEALRMCGNKELNKEANRWQFTTQGQYLPKCMHVRHALGIEGEG